MTKLLENVTIKRRLKDLQDVQRYLDDLADTVRENLEGTKAIVEAIRTDIEWAIKEHDV